MKMTELWMLYEADKPDNGAPLDFIQGMLGHEKPSTSELVRIE